MNYYDAVQSLKLGKHAQSVVSGRIVRPSEMGQIWAGKHWAAHNNIQLTREEIGGLWEAVEPPVHTLKHTSLSWKEVRREPLGS